MLTEPGGVTGMALIPCGSFFSPNTVFADRMAVVPSNVVLKKLRRERSVGLFFLTPYPYPIPSSGHYLKQS